MTTAGLCHGEASCGGYDNDPRDGQCGHAGQVACASVPWGSRTVAKAPRRPAALGVYVENVASSEEVALDGRGMSPRQCDTPPAGTLIDTIQPGGAAAVAGLVGGERLVGDLGYVGGDVIVALNGSAISDTNVLQAETAQYSAGETIQVTVVHCDGGQATMPVTLGTAALPGAAPSTSSTTASNASNASTVPDDQDAYPDCYIANAANPAQAVKKLPKACQ
jgi:membrane-associated protease RseP (regulator of RpoE activity)